MKKANQKLSFPSRILLVDDDSIFRSEFKEYFQDYGIAEASNGEEALQLLKSPHEIDLVILDVRMSGMNGIEVLDKIRKRFPEMRIFILTGYGSKDVAVEALRGKADDYIEKPLDIEKTKELIENVLGAKRNNERLEYALGDTKSKIERVKHFLQRNFFKKVGLNDASRAVCLSPKYLSRMFKEYAKKGFNEYKLELKIKAAKELLKKSSYNINQISDKLGYQNPESFIRLFKKMAGFTPTEYRKK